MKSFEKMAVTALVVSGCLAPPSFPVKGEERGSGVTPTETPAPTPIETTEPNAEDQHFREEIKEITFKGLDVAIRASHDALRLLKEKTDEHYQYVRANLKEVAVELDATLETPGQEGGGQTVLFEDPIRVLLTKETREAGTVWFAGGFVHEACHVRQFRRYRENFPDKPIPVEIFKESECYQREYNALELLGADSETLQYVQKALEEAKARGD